MKTPIKAEKTILVTGGAGFIGTNLCLSLLKKKHRVVAVDNLITSTGENVRYLSSFPGFTFIKHDITQRLPKSITKLNIDEIYHLACPTGVPNLVPLASEMLMTCSTGTHTVLELARINNAKVLFASSSEVYGNPEVFPQTEDYTGNVDPVGIRSPYEEGKRFSESLVRMYLATHNVNAKIVRIFNTYGMYMSGNDTRVIPNFLTKAKKNLPLVVHGNGKQKRTFCYVDDLVAGLVIVMSKGKKGEVYNIGSDTEITIKKLAELIQKITGTKSKVKSVTRLAHDHHRRMPSLKKITQLGWLPKTTLLQGLRNTIKEL